MGILYTSKAAILRSISASAYLESVKADPTLALRTKINLVANSVLFAFDWKRCEFSWKKPCTWFRFLSNSRTDRVMKAVKKFFSYPSTKPAVQESPKATSPAILNATLCLIPPDPKEVHLHNTPTEGETEFRITWDKPHLGTIVRVGPQGYKYAVGCKLKVKSTVSGTMNSVKHSIQFKPGQIVAEKKIGFGFLSTKLKLKLARVDVDGAPEGSHKLTTTLTNGKQIVWTKEEFRDTIQNTEWEPL